MFSQRLFAGALAFAALASAASPASATERAVAHWPLDTVNVGAKTTPELYSPALTGVSVLGNNSPGRLGNGLDLAGPVNVENIRGFTVSSTATLTPPSVSLLAWVKAPLGAQGVPGAQIVVQSADSQSDNRDQRCGDNAYGFRVASNGGLEFAATTGDGGLDTHVRTAPTAIAPATIWNGQWHAVAGTFNAGTHRMELWLDGQLVSFASAPAKPIDYGIYSSQFRDLFVGRTANLDACGFQAFGGAIDDIRVYDRGLSGPELAYVHDPAQTTSRELPVPPPVIGPGPVTPDPAPVTPPAAPPVTPPAAQPVIPQTPAGAVPTSITAILRESIKFGPGVGAPNESSDALLLQIARLMQDSIRESRSTDEVRQSIIEERRAALSLAASQRDALREAGSKLQNGIEIRIQASGIAGGGSMILASALAVTQKVSSNKLKTTEVSFPTGVYPIGKDGLVTAQVRPTTDAWAAINKALDGNVVGLSLVAKPAELSTEALRAESKLLGPITADYLRLQQQASDLSERVSLLTRLIKEASSQVTNGPLKSRNLPSVPMPLFSAATAAPVRVEAQVVSPKQLRTKLKKVSKARDAASRKAAALTIKTFAAAGSANAPVSTFAIKRCVKRTCPFAIGG